MKWLKTAAICSFSYAAVMLIYLTVYLVGHEYHALFGIVVNSETYDPLLTQYATFERFFISIACFYIIFGLYVLSATTDLLRLPLSRGVIVGGTILNLLLFTLEIWPNGEATSNQGEPHWLISFIELILQLALVVSSIVGTKQCWQQLSLGANWRVTLTIGIGLIAGFMITLHYTPEFYSEWIIHIIKTNKEQLQELSEVISITVLFTSMALPKYLFITLTALMTLLLLKHRRPLIYSIITSFLFFTYLLPQLPFISILVDTSGGGKTMEAIKIVNTLGLLLTTAALTAVSDKRLKISYLNNDDKI